MAVRVGINGFGRIGRNFIRSVLAQNASGAGTEVIVVGINDLVPTATNAHLLKYDSTHGTLSASISSTDTEIRVDGHSIAVFAERDPKALAWGDLGVDVVIESTGLFTSRE